MKQLILLILISIVLFSCQEQGEQKTIINYINVYDSYKLKKSNCNTPEIYKEFYIKRGTFCSSYIVLFVDSTYESESGCEAHSQRSTGEWKIKNNNLSLYPDSKDNYNFICNINIKKTNQNKECVINIKNKYGNPVEGFLILCFDTTKIESTQNLKDKKLDFFNSDTTGIIIINKLKYDSLIFQTLDTVTNKQIVFKSILFPDSMSFIVNTISQQLYSYPTYEYNTNKIDYKMKNGIIEGWELIKSH